MIDISAAGRYGVPYSAPKIQKNQSPVKASFDSSLSEATAVKNRDVVSLSTGSYEQRLERLKQLHAETDYSGMSDEDKARLITNRFREAFGSDYGAICGNFYGYFLGKNTIYQKIQDEEARQCMESGAYPEHMSSAEMSRMFRYRMGYENLSDDEIREKISERYNSGALTDRWAAAWELMNCDIDGYAAAKITHQIVVEMEQGTEAQYGRLFRDNPVRIDAMVAYAKNTKMNWTQLTNHMLEAAANGTYYDEKGHASEALKNKALAELEACMSEFLEHMNGIRKVS